MTSVETFAIAWADPKIGLSNTGEPSSFAYGTARERWPKILNQALDEVKSAAKITSNEIDRSVAEEIKQKIATLKQEIAKDGILSLLQEDDEVDIPDYNAELTYLGDPTWLNAPWLYAECYLYRLLHQFIAQSGSPYWQDFDIFASSKRSSLIGSRKGTMELVRRFKSMLSATKKEKGTDHDTRNALFEEMVQISLWGNATDLSLLQSVSIDQLDSIQGKKAREASKANVLVDDTGAAFDLLDGAEDAGKEEATGEIHYVLDNAGFELLTDLVFASFILASGYTRKVTLHGKRIPWFVSDVTNNDLSFLVDGFVEGSTYPDLVSEDKQELQEAGKHWQELFCSGQLSFQAHPFWTTSHPFGRMAVVAPELHTELANGDLVIYKGDLNYRKLTYDGQWPHTTPFSEALGPLKEKQNGKGTRTFALRTAKSDVAVGIPAEKLEGLPSDWTYSGKWGMVQYWDGKA